MPHLELRNLSKSFGPTRAVRDVSFALREGSVLALIGENGAGKSTIVKLLTGVYQPDAGEIWLAGSAVKIQNPSSAWELGISVIHQETVMFDELSVAENLFMGHLPLKRGLVDWKALLENAQTLLDRIEAKIDPRAALKDLSVAQKHLVQIARALSGDSSVVVMDEPTAALSQQEIEDLYRVVRGLRDAGKAVLLITHKFDEVFALCDEYVVLRDGVKVGEGEIGSATPQGLIALMAGREVGNQYARGETAHGEVILEARGYTHPTEFADISFSVRRGEVLGFYGLIGAGRSELMQAIFGLKPAARGSLEIDGLPVRVRSPSDAMRAGLAYVPEDRQRSGAILGMSILHNLTLPSLRGLWLNRQREETAALEVATRLELKAANLEQLVSELSGGNQQKVVIGKWLLANPKMIILDEPTKGIDVGAKAAVHSFIAELVARGMAVILVSSELPEVMALSDRILVMREGRLIAEYSRETATAAQIVSSAAGYSAVAA